MFKTRNIDGPDHDRVYTMSVRLGEVYLGEGKGKSKKLAEQEAAKDALSRMNEAKDDE